MCDHVGMAYIRAHFCAGHVGQVLRVPELGVIDTGCIVLVHVWCILSPAVDGSLLSIPPWGCFNM
jgi:hypothetical protein